MGFLYSLQCTGVSYFAHESHHSRARKIRCDGAKPICHNCQKRPSEAEQCNYDSGPNRRGREKGSTRARTAPQGSTGKKQPTRKRSGDGDHNRGAISSVDIPDDVLELYNVTESDPAHLPPPRPLEDDLFEFSDVRCCVALLWDFSLSVCIGDDVRVWVGSAALRPVNVNGYPAIPGTRHNGDSSSAG